MASPAFLAVGLVVLLALWFGLGCGPGPQGEGVEAELALPDGDEGALGEFLPDPVQDLGEVAGHRLGAHVREAEEDDAGAFGVGEGEEPGEVEVVGEEHPPLLSGLLQHGLVGEAVQPLLVEVARVVPPLPEPSDGERGDPHVG